jgi:hypothetical protein
MKNGKKDNEPYWGLVINDNQNDQLSKLEQ